MTADHPVRRLLARLCSAETMSRVVDPTLADMRVEDSHSAWRGYLALVRALTLYAVVSLPAYCSRLYHDDERAVPRMIALTCVTALVAAIPFVALPFRHDVRSLHIVALLMPQALALTIPAAILVAFPLALQHVTLTGRLRRRAIAVLLVLAALTAVLMDRVMPRANQAFREVTAGRPLPPGTNESGIATLQREIATLKTVRGGHDADLFRHTVYALHLRMALMCAPLPLGILALALSATRSGRQRPWRIASAGVTCYFLTLYPLEFLAQELLRVTALPAPVLAWMPMSAIAVLAAAAYQRALRRAQAA